MRNKESMIEEIKSFLTRFQEEYRKAANEQAFVEKFFINEEDTSLIGAGLNSWHFGLKDIAKVIKGYWEDKSMYLNDIELDIEKASIITEESVAIVSLQGKSRGEIDRDDLYRRKVEQLAIIFKETKNFSLLELGNMLSEISIIKDYEDSEEAILPFRVTLVMNYDNGMWRIKHMNISFAQGEGEDMLSNDNIDESYKTIPISKKDSESIKEVKKVLKVLQEGYDKRDPELAEKYAKELFPNSEEVSIIGTMIGEEFKGFDGGKELLECDWECWGDFKLNIEDAYISVIDNVATVCAKSFVKFTYNRESFSNFPKVIFEEELENKSENKKILGEVHEGLMTAISVLTTSDDKTTAPIKFIGVLTKRDGEWKFNHMHFSHTVDRIPERLKSN